jgi:hypothetical protein
MGRRRALLGRMARRLQMSVSMMIKLTHLQGALAAVSLVICTNGYAQTQSTPHTYPSGVKAALQIESDLYNSLDDKYRNKVEAPPEITGSMAERELAKVQNSENAMAKALGQASISASFVDFINHVAHAKAVDKVQPGFFDQYMSGLARDTANGTPPVAPNIVDDRFWTDDVMNDQASYFNQMMGMTMALNLSHHYLGDFDKYAGQLRAGGAINNFITPKEWEKAVRAAAVNTLNCAFGTDGAKALFGAIDKMPKRPTWTAAIVPQNTDLKQLNNQLAKYEVAFFHGGLN